MLARDGQIYWTQVQPLNKTCNYLFKRKYNIRATELLREQIFLLQPIDSGTLTLHPFLLNARNEP